MNECLKEIIKELQQMPTEYRHEEYNVAIWDAIRFIERSTKINNNGWIPCDERLPEEDEYILLSFSNFSVPLVGRYEEDENGGAFYVGDEDESCVSQGAFVNAWQPLPKVYQPPAAVEEEKDI